jgi:hypothetical protein
VSKIKLTESDLRSVIRAVLQEESPAELSTDAGTGNPRDVKITEKSAPGLKNETENLNLLLAQITPSTFSLNEGSITSILAEIDTYSKLGGYSGVIEQRTPIIEDSIETTRIALVKEFIRYNIMLALDNKHPNQLPDDKIRHAFFDKEVAYISSNVKDSVENTTQMGILYGNSKIKIVNFNTQEFYDLLTNDAFVTKLTNWDKQLMTGGGVWIEDTLSNSATEKIAAEITEAASAAKKIYSQFDNDMVEAFFVAPLLNPGIWKGITGPSDYPLYTPWRQTWVMLNILTQAMSIPGGLEGLYMKFSKVALTGELSSAGPNIAPSSQNVFSANLFKSVNESKRIMVTLSELRRLITAALMLEAPRGGSVLGAEAGEFAGGAGDLAGATTRGLKTAGESIVDAAKNTVKALDGKSGEIRAGIVDAINSTTKKSNILPAALTANKQLAATTSAFKDGVKEIGTFVDDELVAPDFWQRAGAGTDTTASANAKIIVDELLKARQLIASKGSVVPDMAVIEKVAEDVIANPEVADGARALIKKAIEIQVESGSLANFSSDANIERIYRDISSKPEFTSSVEAIRKKLFDDIESVLPAEIDLTDSGVPQKITNIIFDQTTFKISYDSFDSGTGVRTRYDTTVKDFLAGVKNADDSEAKTAALEKFGQLDLAIQRKFPDGTDIGLELVRATAIQNSEGVMQAAYAITTNARYSRHVAQIGTASAGDSANSTIKTLAKMADQGVKRWDAPKSLNPFKRAKIEGLKREFALSRTSRVLKTLTSSQRYVGRQFGKILNVGGMLPGTVWDNLAGSIEKSTWGSTLIGSILVSMAFKGIERQIYSTPAAEAEFRKSWPVVSKIFDFGSLMSGTSLTYNIKFLLALMTEGVLKVSSDDKSLLDDVAKAAQFAAEDLGNALAIYRGLSVASPGDFIGLSSKSTNTGIGDTVARAGDSAGAKFFRGLQFLAGPSFRANDAIKEIEGSASDLAYVLKTVEGSNLESAGNATYDNLEANRIKAINDVIASLNSRKGGVGSQSPAVISVESYKAALIRDIQKIEPDDVNYSGRLIVHFLAGAEDPARVDEVLGAFDVIFDYDFEKGDTFKQIQAVIGQGDPKELQKFEEFRKDKPDEYRRLGIALSNFASKYKEFIDYVPTAGSQTVEAPTAP